MCGGDKYRRIPNISGRNLARIRLESSTNQALLPDNVKFSLWHDFKRIGLVVASQNFDNRVFQPTEFSLFELTLPLRGWKRKRTWKCCRFLQRP